MSDIDFASLGLADGILAALREEGYSVPTPVQARSIPPLLAGKDLLGIARTGTGKTAAFALPIIQHIIKHPIEKRAQGSVRALVVAPTRELAAQIDESFAAYGRSYKISRACVFGGVGKTPQIQALWRGVDVLVATPGRLLDLLSENKLRLDRVEFAVLDEADRMLDMGFIRDVRRIVALLPRERQTALFSATMPEDIASLAGGILRDPVRIACDPERPAAERIAQKVIHLDKNEKRGALSKMLNEDKVSRAIVFTRTKHGANRLVKNLDEDGIGAAAIHANKSQSARTRALADFRAGTVRVLVATDLAARGIDVDGITHVVNFDLPHEPETYVHRIGRTARAGASGIAVSFCEPDDRPLLRAIEKLIGQSVPAEGTMRPASPSGSSDERRQGSGSGGRSPNGRGSGTPRGEGRPSGFVPFRGRGSQPQARKASSPARPQATARPQAGGSERGDFRRSAELRDRPRSEAGRGAPADQRDRSRVAMPGRRPAGTPAR